MTRLIKRTLTATLKGDITRIYNDNPTAKSLLYNWMLIHGYDVTEDMTLLRMIRILVGSAGTSFIIRLSSLFVYDAEASISEGVAYIPNGATIDGNKLVLEDIENA